MSKSKSKSRVICNVCNDEFCDKSSLLRHKRSHHPEELEHECPTCGKLFNMERAVRSHHKQVHDESLRDTNTCPVCGDEFVVCPSTEQTYCSNECMGVGTRKRVDIECEICGDTFEITEGKAGRRSTCSVECMSKRMETTFSGENHPSYKPSVHITKECKYCDGEFTVNKNRIKNPDSRQTGEFCSVDCFKSWQSENWYGENHPSYEGGRCSYGKGWGKQRNAARERDNYTCQDCGVEESDYDRELSVHHIIPYKDFDSDEKANRLDNLVTLCNECHVKWEGLYLRPHND